MPWPAVFHPREHPSSEYYFFSPVSIGLLKRFGVRRAFETESRTHVIRSRIQHRTGDTSNAPLFWEGRIHGEPWKRRVNSVPSKHGANGASNASEATVQTTLGVELCWRDGGSVVRGVSDPGTSLISRNSRDGGPHRRTSRWIDKYSARIWI